MSFKPIGKWLTVRFRPPSLKTKSGLYLPRPEYSQLATVVSVGEQVEHISPGDTVMMHKHGDAMDTQKGLWYHYLSGIQKNPNMDFEVAPVVITEDDVFGKWDDEVGLVPHKNNVVFVEYTIPEKVKGIYRVLHRRQNRKPVGEILRVSEKATFKVGDKILLGQYGGIYFIDLDGKEKVLLSSSEILGKFLGSTNINKIKISISEPREQNDPKAGLEFFNQ